MTEIFADSFYYIALLNPSDQFHQAALAATRKLRRPLVTTFWVLTEVGDALSAPVMRSHTYRFLQKIMRDSNTFIVPYDLSWHLRGLTLYGNRTNKSWSLTDCISFGVMAERGITDALTGDGHFVQAGFRALLLTSSKV